MIPYGLRKIWSSRANRSPGGIKALALCMSRSAAWSQYQLQKQLGIFPPQGRSIPWVDGLRVQLLSNSQASQACLYFGIGDWPSMQFLRRYLRPGDLCADIGANVGIYTLLMARCAGSSNVHAFECLPTNIHKLRANLKLNGFDGNAGVVVHDVALADHDSWMLLQQGDGDVTASTSPLSGGSNEIQLPPPGIEMQWVQACRLDGLNWSERFAYIKMDVEGAEQLVLRGSEHLLSRCAPMVWSFEYLDTQQRLGSSKAELLARFAKWDYQFFLYRPASNSLVPFISDANGSYPRLEDDNVLAIHRSALDQVARRLCCST